jgi:hypothetical protein
LGARGNDARRDKDGEDTYGEKPAITHTHP